VVADLTLVRGEIQVGAELEQLIAAAEVVFYMAGSSTPVIAHADPGGSIASHLAPALAVCSLVGKVRASRLVMASSGGTVYGIPERVPTDERHPTRPVNLHGEHSLTLERYSRFFAAANGFDVTLLRYSNPYGPGQSSQGGQGVIAAWCRALAEGEPLVLFGDPETRRDFIFVDDLVEATIRAAFDAPPDTYNVGSGVATSLREVIDLLAQDPGSPAAVLHEDQRPVDLPITQLDASLLSGLTGWRPRVSLEEGLRRCVEAPASARNRNR
jgi:UDP-glucose 4-epimerase